MLSRASRWSMALVSLALLAGALPAQEGHTENVEAAAFTPDGRLALTASDDKTVGIWEAATGRMVRRLTGHTDAVLGLAVAPEGSRVASLAAGGEVKVWEIETGRCLLTYMLPYRSYALTWTPSGRQLLVADDRGGVEFRDPFRGDVVWKLTAPPEAAQDFGWSLLVTADSRYVVAGMQSGRVRVWGFDSRQWQRDLPGPEDRVWALAATPDGRLLAVGYGWGGEAWDLATGQRRFTLAVEAPILSLAITPEGRKLVTGSSPTTVWDTQTGQCLRRPNTPDPKWALWALSPDCRRALGAWDTQETHRVEIIPLTIE